MSAPGLSVVNVHDAKTHLSRLLDRAHAGEEIIIAKAGKPFAKLVKLDAPAPARPLRTPGSGRAAMRNGCRSNGASAGSGSACSSRSPRGSNRPPVYSAMFAARAR